MERELEEAVEYLEHEVKVYENNKEINQLIGGKLGEMQHKTYKTVLNYIDNSIPKDKIIKKEKELINKLTEVNNDRWETDDAIYYNKIKAQIKILKDLLEEGEN